MASSIPRKPDLVSGKYLTSNSRRPAAFLPHFHALNLLGPGGSDKSHLALRRPFCGDTTMLVMDKDNLSSAATGFARSPRIIYIVASSLYTPCNRAAAGTSSRCGAAATLTGTFCIVDAGGHCATRTFRKRRFPVCNSEATEKRRQLTCLLE